MVAPDPYDSEPLDTIAAVETPEHTVFRYRVAGIARRSAAHVSDLILCYAVLSLFVVGVIVSMSLLGSKSALSDIEGIGTGLVLLAVFCVQWVWFVVWEGTTGTTPGKRLVGLRVVGESGRPIGLRQAALRNVLRAADWLPLGYAVGILSMLWTSRFQRLGDLLAGTMVVVAERARGVTPIRLFPPARPDELALLPPRVALSSEEREALELFLRRRGTLGYAREHELASKVAGPLAHKYGATPPGDPARFLALLYDQSESGGLAGPPPSSRVPESARQIGGAWS